MNSDFKDLLAALCECEVRFLVVGGYAVMFHSEPRFTKDIDLWIEPTRENAERLRAVLVRFGGWLDHMRIEDFCEGGVMFQLGLPPSRVDLMTSVPGLEFEASWRNREQAPMGELTLPILGLDDLIVAKKEAGRDQDLIDLAKLTEVRRSLEGGA